ncbi:MAG: HIRAN domain-containing protein [Prevotella sp.]|nr:HIRAN domain-containing protein [Prevotella sp.]
MEKIRIDVVGLYHGDVRSQWKEYASKAVGKQLVLQPQPENVKDPYAVRVREGTLHIGYVAVPDIDVVYQALKGSCKQRLRGVVVESNPDPPVLTVEIDVEKIDWDYEPFDDSVYDGWHYDGLALMPRRLEQLGDLTNDLLDELEGSSPQLETALQLTHQLLESNLYDMSREMTRARYRIERQLALCDAPEWQDAAQQLKYQKGMLMRHLFRDQVARYLFVELPMNLREKGLEDYHYTYDNRLDELKSQLAAFPYQLYDKFLNDPVDFLREVYYKHVPRKYLFQLLSGIVLMILKGQVKIQRWGREGDTEPIQLIENLEPLMTPSEREEAMKEGLKVLLKMKDESGKLVINQKNQWAGIISILSFDYGVESTDLRDMCRLMGTWGFSEESGYENYCSYESVSKCSDYANAPFHEWRGTGTAHKRQVRAATELRSILRPKIGHR